MATRHAFRMLVACPIRPIMFVVIVRQIIFQYGGEQTLSVIKRTTRADDSHMELARGAIRKCRRTLERLGQDIGTIKL